MKKLQNGNDSITKFIDCSSCLAIEPSISQERPYISAKFRQKVN